MDLDRVIEAEFLQDPDYRMSFAEVIRIESLHIRVERERFKWWKMISGAIVGCKCPGQRVKSEGVARQE